MTTTPRRFVKDAYGNQALVTGETDSHFSIIQLAGSDYGRRTSISKKATIEVTGDEWANARAETLGH